MGATWRAGGRWEGMRQFFRHPSRDHAGPGTWFVTINTCGNRELFGTVVDARVQLSALGRIVRDVWLEVPLHFPHVAPDGFIVMPNQMHSILRVVGSSPCIQRRRDRMEAFGSPVPGSVATILRTFKSAATRAIREHAAEPIIVWQSRYYDRRIRDERGLQRARRYVADNPPRWQERHDYRATRAAR
jgi:REP element-mobilizing transposase RayT